MSPHIMPPAAFLQEQSNWCWAAVAGVVLRCMGVMDMEREPESFHNQCTLARKMFDEVSSRIDMSGESCCPFLNENGICPYNHGVNIQEILDLYQQYGIKAKEFPGALPFAYIRDEINLGRPVQVIFKYINSDGGHVAVIYGYVEPEGSPAYLIINDPLEGWDLGYVSYNYLSTFYDLACGAWWKTLYEFEHIQEDIL